MSFSEMCQYVYPKNVIRNCSSPSKMVCKDVVEFLLEIAGTILHGVFIKRDYYNRKLLLSTEEIILFQGQSTFFYTLVPSRLQGPFPLSFWYIFLFLKLLLITLWICIHWCDNIFRRTLVNTHFFRKSQEK